MKLSFIKKNYFYIIFVLILLVFKAPTFFNNLAKKGIEVKNEKVINLANQKEILFPNKDAIVIFWASYCGPCKIEMSRLNESVVSGKIDKNKIFAVNSFEDLATQNKFITSSKLNFQFIDNSALADKLNVNVTPTTVFISDNKVKSISSGLSIIGIWLAEYFY